MWNANGAALASSPVAFDENPPARSGGADVGEESVHFAAQAFGLLRHILAGVEHLARGRARLASGPGDVFDILVDVLGAARGLLDIAGDFPR